MNKEKQIEEMARDLSKVQNFGAVVVESQMDSRSFSQREILNKDVAEALYAAGYRKQIEGENDNLGARELLPCPFCGGEAEYIATSRKASGDLRGFGFTIACKHCGVKLPKTFEIDFRLNGIGEIEVESKGVRECAARMWNTREKE